MTLHQIEALAIIAGMLVLFLSDRLRYDLVGASALSAATLLGVVPAHKAFSGFSSPVVIIIASVLVVSRAVAVSGIIDRGMRWVLRGAALDHGAGRRADRRGDACCRPSSRMSARWASSCRWRYRRRSGRSGRFRPI